MLQVQFSDQCNLNESQIYEDLSQIIKSFKNLLNSLDFIANCIQRFESTSQQVDELKNNLKVLQGYVKMYSFSIGQQSQHRNTFHRFICRLIESISAYKLKLQVLPYSSLLSYQIREIQQIVMSYQQDRNIGLVIKKIQAVINRFCSKTLKHSQSNNLSAFNDKQVTYSDKKSQFTTITHEYPNSQDKNSAFSLTVNEMRPKKVLQSKSQNSLNKVMTILNRKYRSISCLDIDYQQFKQLFFRSRDGRDQLFDDCFQRNSYIYKEMLRYSKQFSEYLQKRELKIFRKNKFVDSLGHYNLKVKTKHNSSKANQAQQTSYNFMKKKIPNDYRKNFEQNVLVSPQNQSQSSSPYLFGRSQLVQDKFSNLVSIEHQIGHMTPQLIQQKKKPNIFPLMISGQNFMNQKQKFQQVSEQTLLQLSKRKKNLQLKKIDISLSSFSNGTPGEIQSAKAKNIIFNPDTFKKTYVQTTKQMDQRINASIRKNYIQKKYEQAMKKNFGDSFIEMQKDQRKQATPSKFSSTKCIDMEQQGSLTQMNRQRKYLIKTSNKRSFNPGTQFKSLNPVNQRKEVSTIKKFRKLKMDQVQKIQKLQKMKQMALNYMELSSGGKAIRPALVYRQKQIAPNIYTEIGQQQYLDANFGSHKQFQTEQKFI